MTYNSFVNKIGKARVCFTALALVLCLLPVSARQDGRYGIIEYSACYMREEPGYTKELGNQALMGTVVKLGEKTGYWQQITSPEPYTAWINDMAVVEKTPAEIEEYIAAPKYLVCGETAHLFKEPSLKAERICDLVMGDLLRICFDRKDRPVKKRGFLKAILPSGRAGWVAAGEVADFEKWANNVNASPESIRETAELFIGVPYLWGGNTIKGTDCSGLVKCAYMNSGILMPRNSSQLIKAGEDVDISGIPEGDFSALEVGDLIFFGNPQTKVPTHVAIYYGDGRIIHSSMTVRINSLRPSDPDYYSNALPRLIAVRRVLGNVDCGKGFISIKNSPWYFLQK